MSDVIGSMDWFLVDYLHLVKLICEWEHMCIMNISNRLLDDSSVFETFVVDIVAMDLMPQRTHRSMNVVAETCD